MYYAQPNQTAVMFWHHLATSLKTSQPLQNKLSMSHIHQLYWISQEFVKKIDELLGRILLIDDGAENFMHLLIW